MLEKKKIMGRTLPPHRRIFEGERREWEKRLKKTNYNQLGKELFSGGAQFNDAGSNWGTGQVREKVLFLLLFSQYKALIKQ